MGNYIILLNVGSSGAAAAMAVEPTGGTYYVLYLSAKFDSRGLNHAVTGQSREEQIRGKNSSLLGDLPSLGGGLFYDYGFPIFTVDAYFSTTSAAGRIGAGSVPVDVNLQIRKKGPCCFFVCLINGWI